MNKLLFVFSLFTLQIQAQQLSKSDKKIIGFLKSQVTYLASDELKGRRAGDAGELIAAEYISSKFREIGLLPKGTSKDQPYFQPFDIYNGKIIDDGAFLKVNDKSATLFTDYFPISNSTNGLFNGSLTPSINENEQPWMIDLADDLNEQKDNPHFDIHQLINDKLTACKIKNVPFVIFYNTSSFNDNLTFDAKDRSSPTPVPAIYLTKTGKDNLMPNSAIEYTIQLQISISPSYRKARNVIGYIDNNAPLTIVLGAHFDHLGYGEDGNSMIRNGEPAIHNGADDNASGTASLIELAFALNKRKSKHYNYLFIAFSAEELGLNGSKYFVENPTISLKDVNYMINMDMVGRMNDSTKTITVGGYGTSSSWERMLSSVKDKGFSIKIDSSGSGPSDHTSFYRKDIPVLFFFTGLHTDYHKPSDDADKINYIGLFRIVRFIEKMILNDHSASRLIFLKTREQQTSTSARFSVSMGIMPDYSFNGNGVRVDGVTDNRPAKKAGILAGDIVKQLGETKTSSVEAYMQALSKFKKGDTTTVLVQRKDVELTFEIVF